MTRAIHFAAGQRPPVACWRLNGTAAQLTTDSLQGSIEVTQPHLGVRDLRIAGKPLAGWTLAVDVETPAGADRVETWAPHEAYVRGNDLIAAYRKPLGQPFNLQAYWRMQPCADDCIAIVDAIISIHTPLWEAYPVVTISSAIGDKITAQSSEVLVRRTASDLHCVELSRLGDFAPSHSESSAATGISSVSRYGGVFLERGVIRRLHLRTIWLPTEPNASAIAAMLAAFLIEEPPLTT